MRCGSQRRTKRDGGPAQIDPAAERAVERGDGGRAPGRGTRRRASSARSICRSAGRRRRAGRRPSCRRRPSLWPACRAAGTARRACSAARRRRSRRASRRRADRAAESGTSGEIARPIRVLIGNTHAFVGERELLAADDAGDRADVLAHAPALIAGVAAERGVREPAVAGDRGERAEHARSCSRSNVGSGVPCHQATKMLSVRGAASASAPVNGHAAELEEAGENIDPGFGVEE